MLKTGFTRWWAWNQMMTMMTNPIEEMVNELWQCFLKVEKYLFYLFIFTIPFQARIFLYDWGGTGSEFSSSFLYLSDIILACLFLFWLIRGVKINIRKSDKFLLAFFVFAALSIFSHGYISFGIYQIIKLFEFLFLYFYIRESLHLLELKKVLLVFIFAGFFQALLAIFQFFGQSDLGLRYLGETVLSPTMDGVAKIDTETGKIMRPYGTFTHPNVLAAFLFFSLVFYYALEFLKLEDKKIKNLYFFFGRYITFFIILFAFFLTFSRSAWLAFFVFSLLLLIKFSKEEIIKKSVFLSVTFFVLLGFLFFPELLSRLDLAGDKGLGERVSYENIAETLIAENPFFGVGLGNFVNEFKDTVYFSEDLNWIYQPVHNIYLLVFSEIGVFGFIFFILFLSFLIKDVFEASANSKFSIIFLAIAFCVFLLFFLDHYFWDIQQGRMMLWFFLGILAAFIVNRKVAL